MKDKLKAIEYNLIEISKRIGQLNYHQINYQVEEQLKKISELVYEVYDELETMEIIIEDQNLKTSGNNYEDRNAN